MIVFMIRGQSSGVMHDRVYFNHPTEEQFAEALGEELDRHGLSKEGEPRDRWIQVQEVELVGAPAAFEASQKAGPGGGKRLVGKLTEEDAKARLEAGPPATAVAGVGEVVATGSGSVINPGEPGHVPGKK